MSYILCVKSTLLTFTETSLSAEWAQHGMAHKSGHFDESVEEEGSRRKQVKGSSCRKEREK